MEARSTITVRPETIKRLWNLRQRRNIVPEKKPGRGRPHSDMESMADLVDCATKALEKERKHNP